MSPRTSKFLFAILVSNLISISLVGCNSSSGGSMPTQRGGYALSPNESAATAPAYDAEKQSQIDNLNAQRREQMAEESRNRAASEAIEARAREQERERQADSYRNHYR